MTNFRVKQGGHTSLKMTAKAASCCIVLLLVWPGNDDLLFLLSTNTAVSTQYSQLPRTLKFEENEFLLDPNDVGENHEFRDLRFATFGTSRTWGSGLRNRSLAYPYLLSPQTKNYAIRAAGPKIPSLCTYSIVQEEIFDVIVFEFFLQAPQGLVRLARRLRQRFPRATFIFLQISSPFQFTDTKGGRTLADLMRDKELLQGMNFAPCLPLGCALKEYYKLVDSIDTWFYTSGSFLANLLERVAKETGGHIVTPGIELDHPKEGLKKLGALFVNDQLHFSAFGHRWIRESIVQVLRAKGVVGQKKKQQIYEVDHGEEVNPWKEKDYCVDFFESGNTSSLVYDQKLQLNQFVSPNHSKYALEIRNDDLLTNRKSWVEVNNPFQETAELVISHMAKGPDFTTYPQMRFQIIDPNHVHQSQEIFTRALLSNDTFPVHVHVVTQTKIGVVPPGKTNVSMEEVEKNTDPFRLTGVYVIVPDTSEKEGSSVVSVS